MRIKGSALCKRTGERIGYGYDETKLGKGPVIRNIIKQKGYETYVTRVRVSIEGILRDETRRTVHSYPYRFIIEQFLSVDEIVVGYEGELTNGWIYSDTIDHVGTIPTLASSFGSLRTKALLPASTFQPCPLLVDSGE